MTIQHSNASMSFDSQSAIAGDSGSNIYRLVNRSPSSTTSNIVLVALKESFGSQVSVEVADDLEFGYLKLAKDIEEGSIAAQRRVNRGSLPGRLLAD